MLHRRALLVLIAALSATACRNGDGAPTSLPSSARGWTPARTAELYFTTEVSGYVEPCGCTTKPLGGLPRLATIVRKGRDARALVDAGNLLFPSSGVDAIAREQHVLKAALLARAYRRLGVVALNVGAADLHEGAKLLRKLQQKGATPFVSANVVPVGDHAPEVARSYVRRVGDIKVGITGAATPESVASKDGVTVLEYAPAVTAEVKSLQDRDVDVVVVLAHMSDPLARELAQTVGGIDIIIRAPGTGIESPPSAPIRQGRTIIAEVGSQGQYVGRVTIALGSDQPASLEFDDGEATYRSWRAKAERRIRAYRTEVAAWQEDPAKAAAVLARTRKIASLEAQLAEPPPAVRPPQAPYVRVDRVALTTDIPEDPDVRTALKSYYSQLQKMNASKGDPARCAPQPDRPTYVGTARCAGCHEEAFAFWRKTKHAAAWETLEKDNKQFDLTCVGCHVVGYQEPGGFCRIKDVSVYEDVGCENCHGPGSAHVEDEEPESIVLESTEATCAGKCHVPEHSDAFDYERYMAEVTGPGHERQSD